MMKMTKNPRLAAQFPTKKAAADHAALIGWPKTDARPIDVMGFRLWAIMDEHTLMLTWPDYTALLLAKNPPYDPMCPCEAHRVQTARAAITQAKEETQYLTRCACNPEQPTWPGTDKCPVCHAKSTRARGEAK